MAGLLAVDTPKTNTMYDIAYILYHDWETGSRLTQAGLVKRIPALQIKDALRKLRGHVEALRKAWELPILSTDCDPCGYWMARTKDEFEAFSNRKFRAAVAVFRSSLKTQLAVAKVCGLDVKLYAARVADPRICFENHARVVKPERQTVQVESL